jgi:hypothetical protein
MLLNFIVKNGDSTGETTINQLPAYLPPRRVPQIHWLQNSEYKSSLI